MDVVVSVAVAWSAVLVAVLSVVAARGESLVARILWMDTLALVLIGLLALLGYARSDPAYLDAGMVLALLAFAGTLAAARYQDEGRL